ncbi:glycosyltransferase [Siccirubricoccus phaeus]|uniref:glycosyltransferase n=1 Tax=Siccirubricoccus phaeus TaxID=2595053 RepID=UPI00165B7FB8|nr:glycosyltransferase [Siccirubricoccus phaeus]
MAVPDGLRVLHVVPTVDQGGAQKLLADLVSHAPPWATHRIIALTGDPPFFEFGAAEIFRLGLRRGEVSFQALSRARAQARAFAPHAVHGWLYHGNLLASLLLPGVPLLWSIHNTSLPRADTAWLTRAIARLSGMASGWVPHRIVYCSADARTLHERELGYAAAPGRVIPNGVDFAAFAFSQAARDRLRASWGLGPAEVAIGSIGRWDPQKDHATVAAALALLPPGPRRWVVAGTGCEAANPDLAALLGRHGLAGRTLALGPRQDMPALLSALDLLVIGSAYGEAMPVVGLEAAANGLPVVATRVGSAPLLVAGPELLAAPRHPADLARAIAAATPRSQAAVTVRERLRPHCDIAATTRTYHRLYRALAGNDRSTELRPRSGDEYNRLAGNDRNRYPAAARAMGPGRSAGAAQTMLTSTPEGLAVKGSGR